MLDKDRYMKLRYKILAFFLLAVCLFSEEIVIQVETEKSIINIENESMVASGGIILKYGDMTIRADNMKKLENQSSQTGCQQSKRRIETCKKRN